MIAQALVTRGIGAAMVKAVTPTKQISQPDDLADLDPCLARDGTAHITGRGFGGAA